MSGKGTTVVAYILESEPEYIGGQLSVRYKTQTYTSDDGNINVEIQNTFNLSSSDSYMNIDNPLISEYY